MNGYINPVIEFYHSTNVTIQNCTFQHSVGQAVGLLEVSGIVKIDHCSFLYNKHYKGHGTAVYFLLSDNFQRRTQLMFTIKNSSFSKNEGCRSIMYIGQYSKNPQLVLLNGLVFNGNKGISLYLSNQNLHLLNNILFDNNEAEYGSGIFVSNYSTITFSENSVVTFNQNTANNSGGAIFLKHSSSAIFKAKCFVMFNNNKASHYGGSIFSYNNSNVVLKENSTLLFINNVAQVGGALYIETNSAFTIAESYSVVFNSNKADLGGAVCVTDNSVVLLEGNKTLYNNIIKSHDATVPIFSTYNFTNNTMMVVFTNNSAIQGGAAMYVKNKSVLKVTGKSLMIFIHNSASHKGGAIICHRNSSMLFEKKSHTIFIDNEAEYGGAVYLESNATIMFKGNSLVEFTVNDAEQNGGAVFFTNSSGMFQENCTVRYINNTAESNGGAAYFTRDTDIKHNGYSIIIFHKNEAAQGGAVYSESNTNITVGGQSKITFTNNIATFGGAVYCYNNTIITTNGQSLVILSNNTALEQGGAFVIKHNSDVKLVKRSTVIFESNKAAHNGGSVFVEFKSGIYFKEHCRVTFNSNKADDGIGGAISLNTNSVIEFYGNSVVIFYSNNATQGGALSLYSYSIITFQGGVNSTVTFFNNKATQTGGAMYLQKISDITFKGSITVKLHNNEATVGGAIICNSNSGITFKESPHIEFLQNIAKLGGAIYIVRSNITITDNSKLIFSYNIALQDGGALFLDKQFKVIFTVNVEMTFSFNTATDYGGAIYSRVDQSVINFNITNIHFNNNHARTAGSSVFINVPKLCNSSCLNNSVLGVTEGSLQHNQLRKHLTTSPRKLELYQPVECIDNSSVACDSYYVKNIMLGQEILIYACMYDYYDRSTGTEEFLVSATDDQDYYVPGSQYILMSCNHTFQGISINGNTTTPVLPFNYSMTIGLYVVRISEMKTISVSLTVELSPCHPGFWYDNTSQKCECYNSTGIVLCSGRSSTIKKGYWFGSVTEKPTVTFCPIDYCNFTCCETINGYYHLSPVRDNQCMLHRSGTACGDCEAGYSLSFDSTECIGVKVCTIGQMILLIILIILYWIAITVAVFVMMYFKVEIGNLYGITYYYSIVDILLSQNWFLSNRKLYTLINIMSSITKITPQFLGQLCLIQGMSGIDQQFVHYMHPLAVSLIIVSISYLARKSRRLSFYVRRGIICFICFLLLLSYTSVANTSLLLMRPLTFHNVDKTYTYLSPEIMYFHGRHLVYGIVAVLLTILIVIGTIYVLLLLPLIGLITMKLWIHRNNIKMMIVYCSSLKCKHSRSSDEIPLNDCKTQLLKELIIDDNMRKMQQ